MTCKGKLQLGKIFINIYSIAMKLIVTFETSVLDKNGFHDLLKIVSNEGYERDVPLHAYP